MYETELNTWGTWTQKQHAWFTTTRQRFNMIPYKINVITITREGEAHGMNVAQTQRLPRPSPSTKSISSGLSPASVCSREILNVEQTPRVEAYLEALRVIFTLWKLSRSKPIYKRPLCPPDLDFDKCGLQTLVNTSVWATSGTYDREGVHLIAQPTANKAVQWLAFLLRCWRFRVWNSAALIAFAVTLTDYR
jgi:hypothetical protein